LDPSLDEVQCENIVEGVSALVEERSVRPAGQSLREEEVVPRRPLSKAAEEGDVVEGLGEVVRAGMLIAIQAWVLGEGASWDCCMAGRPREGRGYWC